MTIDRQALPILSAAGRATVGDQIRRHAASQGDRTAIAAYDEAGVPTDRLSYAELNERVNRIANTMTARGVGRGDVVAICARNSAHYLATYLAATKVGAATTGVNHNFQPAEIAYQLGHASPKVVLTETEMLPKLSAVGAELDAIPIRLVVQGRDIDAPPENGWEPLSAWFADDVSADEPDAEVGEDDILFLVYTSGTEAFPKAVMITHRNYLISSIPAWSIGASHPDPSLAGALTRNTECKLGLSPLHTIAGLGSATITLCIGGTLVLPRTVDAGVSLDLVESERITAISQTPTFFLGASNHPRFREVDLSSVESILTYGGTMPRSMIESWNERCPRLRWATYWGQSELTQLGTSGWFRTLDDIPGQDTSWIGRPLSTLELRLIDADGNVADEGEAWCRSPSAMLGYYNDEERTADTIQDGWLRTGDIMRRDSDGNLFFLDRRKDMIKSGGYNVSSQEVERTLYAYPGIVHAAVVGLPDEYWSEAVTAFVVQAPDTEIDPAEVVRFCKERLTNYKVPKSVVLLTALPVDGQGKVLKRELRRVHSSTDQAIQLTAAHDSNESSHQNP